MKLAWIFADTRGGGTCRSCQAPIVWAEIVKSGKKMPFNPPLVALLTDHDKGSGRLVEGVALDESHFATCPNAPAWRKSR